MRLNYNIVADVTLMGLTLANDDTSNTVDVKILLSAPVDRSPTESIQCGIFRSLFGSVIQM